MPSRWERFADLFRLLEGSKALWNVRHYSISQTPLEQVPRRARQAAFGGVPEASSSRGKEEPGHFGMPPFLVTARFDQTLARPVGGGFVCCMSAARGDAVGHLVGAS